MGILDTITGATAALSLRKVRSAYAGQAVRLRRSSDDAESDFGFDSAGDLDVAAVETWLGVATAYVKTWYDQSGNARDFTQATAARQPTFIARAVNDRPAVRFGADADRWLLSAATVGTILSASAFHVACVFRPKSATRNNASPSEYANHTVWGDYTNGYFVLTVRNNGPTVGFYNYNGAEAVIYDGTPAFGDPYAVQVYRDAGSTYVDLDGTPSSAVCANLSASSLADFVVIGSAQASANQAMVGDVYEWIAWNAALSAGDVSALKADQAGYWSAAVEADLPARVYFMSPKLSDEATITAPNWEAEAPATMLQARAPSKTAQSLTLSNVYVEFDFGEDVALDTFGLTNHNGTADATWRWRAADSSADLVLQPTVDTGHVSLWPSSGMPDEEDWPEHTALLALTNAVAARYWRVDILDAGNPELFFEAGRIGAGIRYQPAINHTLDFARRLAAADVFTETPFGYTQTEARARPREWMIPFDTMVKAEMLGHFEKMLRLRGRAGDVFACLDPTETTFAHWHRMLGYFKDLGEIAYRPGNMNVLTAKVVLRENL